MNCSESGRSVYTSIVAMFSLLFGALIGLLFAYGLIPGMWIASWILLVLGFVGFILLVPVVMAGALHGNSVLMPCLCSHGVILVSGFVGAIVLGWVAVSIDLIPGYLPVILLVSGEAFFFMLLILAWASFILCIVQRLWMRVRE